MMTLSPKSENESTKFFKLMTKCPSDKLLKLLHHLVDLYCGQQNSLFDCYADSYSLVEWWDLISNGKSFLKEYYADDNLTAENLSSLNPEYCNILKEVLDVRSTDLKNRTLEKSHEVSPAYLNSFDWKVVLTLASDKMSHLNEPRLLLDLDIKGNKDEFLRLDLSKEELKSLIESMEKAKNATEELLAE